MCVPTLAGVHSYYEGSLPASQSFTKTYEGLGVPAFLVIIKLNAESWAWPGKEAGALTLYYVLNFIQVYTNSHTITVPEEVTTYTTLIADIKDVHDESSDFELPDTVVAWL